MRDCVIVFCLRFLVMVVWAQRPRATEMNPQPRWHCYYRLGVSRIHRSPLLCGVLACRWIGMPVRLPLGRHAQPDCKGGNQADAHRPGHFCAIGRRDSRASGDAVCRRLVAASLCGLCHTALAFSLAGCQEILTRCISRSCRLVPPGHRDSRLVPILTTQGACDCLRSPLWIL